MTVRQTTCARFYRWMVIRQDLKKARVHSTPDDMLAVSLIDDYGIELLCLVKRWRRSHARSMQAYLRALHIRVVNQGRFHQRGVRTTVYFLKDGQNAACKAIH